MSIMTEPPPLNGFPRPFFTADLRGTGGRIGPDPEDFRVVEIPSYGPAGNGSHCFVKVRKRGITSQEAARRLAEAVGVSGRDVGMAGMKDRRAVADQWMSLPEVAPEALTGLSIQDVEVLEASAHPHKLRTGHLRGNRFIIRLVDTEPLSAQDLSALVARISSHGMPNRFGAQRFGHQGDNASGGRAILMGEANPRDRRTRRLLVSALQSQLFNAYLEARLGWGGSTGVPRPSLGEVLKRYPSGGLFVCDDPGRDDERVRMREVVPTGPLFGPRMMRPAPGSASAALEEEVLLGAGLSRELFERSRKLAPGGRRPLVVYPEDLVVEEPGGTGTLRVSVTLPAGVYATVLLLELTHTPLSCLRV